MACLEVPGGVFYRGCGVRVEIGVYVEVDLDDLAREPAVCGVVLAGREAIVCRSR